MYRFSNKISALKPSAIREILKAASVPGLISFAAGNPAPEAFPVDEIRQITAQILAEEPIAALQYGVTEGYEPLIEAVRTWVAGYGVGGVGDSLIITSGAQQVMDLACKVLCDEGDTVLVEDPSFIGSLNSFRAYNTNLVGLPMESDGLHIAALEDALQTQKNVRFLYTIPNFQNPTGATMSAEKRRAVYALAQKHDLLILEDNPYGDLRVTGAHLPAIKTLDTDGRVIYAGSFSKILSPGLRAGFCVGPAEILAKMTVGKQTGDVHTSMLTQMIVYRWLTGYDVPAHIAHIQAVYRRKLTLMCDLLDEKLAGAFTYVRPEGGLFVWGSLGYARQLGARAATDKMLAFCKTCTEHGVAVVPGSAFLADTNGTTDCLRLNFSTPSDENIIKGVEILRKLVNNE